MVPGVAVLVGAGLRPVEGSGKTAMMILCVARPRTLNLTASCCYSYCVDWALPLRVNVVVNIKVGCFHPIRYKLQSLFLVRGDNTLFVAVSSGGW